MSACVEQLSYDGSISAMSRPSLYYAGSNIFGQVGSSFEVYLDKFVPLEIEGLTNISIGHSLIATMQRSKIFLYGHGLLIGENRCISNVELPLSATPLGIYNCDAQIFVLSTEKNLLILDFHDSDLKFKPFGIKNLHTKIKAVSFGSALNVILTEDLKLYTVNLHESIQMSKNFLPVNFDNTMIIKKVLVGYEHSLILTENGSVLSFGNGRRGQLGHGNLKDQELPRIIEALDGISIVDIACGGWHSCALGKLGEVYAWGWNSHGQIGLSNPDAQVVHEPELVALDANVTIKFIACGSRHTVVISDKNTVYGFGCNKFGQLSLPMETMVLQPTVSYQIPEEAVVNELVCGEAATGIIVCQC